MKKILPLILFSILYFGARSQNTSHQLTNADEMEMQNYLQHLNISSAGITTPPTSPVRASAEWEEIDHLVIAWTSYQSILKEIVRFAQTETHVLIVCSDSTVVKNYLTTNSVPLSNISYVIIPFNSIWARDYGQWNIYTNDVDSLFLIDWIYNRPRPKDDTVPNGISNFTQTPMYVMTTAPNNLIHTGGNFMVDGFGTAFSSNLILNENPTKTSAQIDTIMNHFMGITRYIKMNTLPWDAIHHIDMHLKLLDEETLLVGQYPLGVADGPQIEANLQYILNNFNSVYGTPYKVVRIPMPPDASGHYPDNSGDYRTYTNAVFVNKTVILPTYALQYDTTAVRIYKEALPGYKIKTIDCNSIITQLGAIHCITKEVAASDPLLISHQPLHDTYDTTNAYIVDARIQHRSGISSATLYYRTDTINPYQSITMTQASLINIWEGLISAKPAGTHIYYYVEANSVSGKTQVRPMPAPAGYWKFDVLSTTGIADNKNENTFELKDAFPNPSKGITCIPFVSSSPAHATVVLKDVLGQTVKNIFDGKLKTGEQKFFVNTIDLSSGVYMIEVSVAGKTFAEKLVVR